MNRNELLAQWKAEEAAAHIHGWDFSHIHGRYDEDDDFPWNYRAEILKRLSPEMRLLDIDTGGGEFLLSLSHPHCRTAATEGYPPNISLCRTTLAPLGIDFRPANGQEPLPFEDDSFDMVINRHGDFNPQDIFRILRPGGVFITQQVGAENDRELVQLLLGDLPLPFPDQYLHIAQSQFRQAGFTILNAQECFRAIRFFDVGALVWFARIIEWEFPHFSVDACADRLFHAQHLLDQTGKITGHTHRFLLVAQKPSHPACAGDSLQTGHASHT